MNLRAVLALLAITLVAVTPPLASAAKRSWAQGEIKLVTSKGLMTPTGGAFRPDDALTQGELTELVTGLTGEETRVPASPSSGAVTIAQLDARLVDALGLGDDASLFYRAARAVGIKTRPVPQPISRTAPVAARAISTKKTTSCRSRYGTTQS